MVVLPDLRAVSAAGAERVIRGCRAAIAERGECSIALSGGETPRTLYELLAGEPYRGRVRWERLRVFWGDERCVPPDDSRSNYRMAWESVLAHVPVPAERVHRMPADRDDLEAAADAYAATLRAYLPQTLDGWPRLDLILLGLGRDAHTASLFPGTPAIHETRRAVVVNRVLKLDENRMTLTPPVLNRAGEVIFLVAGADKAEALWKVLEGPAQPDAAPAQVVRPIDGRLAWLVDAPAAARLARRGPQVEREGGG